MSNMGLEVCLKDRGITLLRTDVGDRYVSERMRRDGFVLGGEKSGHVIFGKLTTTGDGLLTALQTLQIMVDSNALLSQLAGVMTEYPQTLINVRVNDRQAWLTDLTFQHAVDAAVQELKGSGRVNVRASGTELLVRVMVEAQDHTVVSQVAGRLSDMIHARWGV
jgi:phosphoglucosamine mutase